MRPLLLNLVHIVVQSIASVHPRPIRESNQLTLLALTASIQLYYFFTLLLEKLEST